MIQALPEFPFPFPASRDTCNISGDTQPPSQGWTGEACRGLVENEAPCSQVLQNMLHMPQSVLEFRVAAVLYAVQTFNFELGHV